MKRLNESDSPVGRLLDAAAPIEEPDDFAWARAHARFVERPPTSRRRLWVGGLVAVAAGVAVALLVLPTREPLEHRHVDERAAWTWVGRDEASGRTGQALVLTQGVLAFEAQRPFELKTPRANLTSSSARLIVMVAGDGHTTLSVHEGFVVVRQPGVADRRVEAGARWESGSDVSSNAAFHRWALELEQEGRPEDALVVLEGLSGSTSAVWAELALYDGARIGLALGRRDQVQGFFERYDARFQDGVLGKEMRELRDAGTP